ncbi:hypothetical protein HDC94_000204 [Leifsonia sp. AK011]|uniref:hypothetical protein n=1 Tax=Leifsonia sp. AK011 TaxID=2723075 RepID=UPI0015CAD095|nr:hypothetical protein [Leifsonia sp. AK011]NYF09048.1 hypothetical protein [Leifsonia sp. AK011]
MVDREHQILQGRIIFGVRTIAISCEHDGPPDKVMTDDICLDPHRGADLSLLRMGSRVSLRDALRAS